MCIEDRRSERSGVSFRLMLVLSRKLSCIETILVVWSRILYCV